MKRSPRGTIYRILEQLCQEHPLVLVLEGATSPGNIVLRRKGRAQFKLTAQGVSAHAGSNPEKGRAPSWKLRIKLFNFVLSIEHMKE